MKVEDTRVSGLDRDNAVGMVCPILDEKDLVARIGR